MNSDTLGKLADALAKAQGMMENAAKDKDNPFFKSSYADLASVWDACRIPLSKNGLSVVQSLSMVESRLLLTSKLIHSSGEWIDSIVPIQPVKPDPQSTGSAITYMRRFSLSALVGIAAAEVDDDGNQASGRSEPTTTKPPFKPQGVPPAPQTASVKAMSSPKPAHTAPSEPARGFADELPPWVK